MKFLTLQQFTEMWKLQDEANTKTSGPNWREKKQNWQLAIKAETVEFCDYVGWKWLKEPDKVKSPKDMQARLELVDIWLFLISEIIEEAEEIPEDYEGQYDWLNNFLKDATYSGGLNLEEEGPIFWIMHLVNMVERLRK